ncbi:MAG: beta strand repeat-containing protein, partial [Bacteroidota bacterium]
TVTGATGDATTNDATIEYNGAIQTVNASFTYHHLTLTGTSTKTASGAITAEGVLTVTSVTFDLNSFDAAAGSLTGSGTITNGVAATTSTLTAGGDGTSTTFSGGILNGAGTVALVKLGTGSLTLSGDNSYTGGTVMSAGSILVQHTNALGTGDVTMNDASTGTNNTSLLINEALLDASGPANNITVANQGSGITSIGTLGSLVPFGATFNGTLTLNKATTLVDGTGDQAKRTTFEGKISGAVGTLTMTGAGRIAFSMLLANDFVGDVVVTSGTLLQTSSEFDHIPDASNVQVAGGWQLITVPGSAVVGTETINNLTGSGLVKAFSVGSGTGVNLKVGSAGGSSTYSGVMENFTSIFALTKVGAGTFTISGVNTYTGTTTINAGVLQLGAAGVIADGSAVTLADVSGVVFDLNNFNETIGTLSGGGTTGGNITLGSGTLTVTQGSEQTYGGVISGSGGLTKTGAARLKLSGANTYTGLTAVNAGQLDLLNSTAAGTPAGGVTVADGAAVELENSITVGAEALTINGNGGSSGAVRNHNGTNTWGGTVTLASNAEIQIDTGTLTFNNATAVIGTNVSLTVDCISGDGSITGTVDLGAGALTKTGAGTLSFGSAGVDVGNVLISGGTLVATSGTMTVSGTWSNNATFDDNGGTVTLVDNSTTIGGSSTTTFNNLIINNTTATNSLTASIAIDANLTVIAGSIFDLNTFTSNRTTAGGTFFLEDGADLHVGGADNFPKNFATVTLEEGTLVKYDLNGAQQMVPPSPFISFDDVDIIGGGMKTANLSLEVRGTLTIDATSTFSVASLVTVGMTSTSSLDNGSGGTITNAGTINSASGLSETGNYNGAGTLVFDATAAPQTIDFGAGFTFDSDGTTRLAGSGLITIQGSTTPTFTRVEINNMHTGDKITASSNWTVDGILQLNQANLDMSTHRLTLSGTPAQVENPNLGATYDVLGRVQRPQASLSAGPTFTFNNQYTTVVFSISAPYGGVPESDVVFNLSTGTAPTPLQAGVAIKRVYAVTSDGATVDPYVPFVASMRLHYQDSELNDNTASDLTLWRLEEPIPNATPIYISKDRTGAVDETNKWAELANVQLFSSWTLANAHTVHTHTWTGLASTDWTSPSNWINGLPHAQDIIIIQNNSPYYPVVPNGQTVEAMSITVEPNAQMTVGNNTVFTINGDFTVGASGTLTIGNNNALTLSGSLSTSGAITVGSDNTLNIDGNVNVTAGSFSLGSTNIINLKGNWTNSVVVTTGGTGNRVNMVGTEVQNMTGLLA